MKNIVKTLSLVGLLGANTAMLPNMVLSDMVLPIKLKTPSTVLTDILDACQFIDQAKEPLFFKIVNDDEIEITSKIVIDSMFYQIAQEYVFLNKKERDYGFHFLKNYYILMKKDREKIISSLHGIMKKCEKIRDLKEINYLLNEKDNFRFLELLLLQKAAKKIKKEEFPSELDYMRRVNAAVNKIIKRLEDDFDIVFPLKKWGDIDLPVYAIGYLLALPVLWLTGEPRYAIYPILASTVCGLAFRANASNFPLIQ